MLKIYVPYIVVITMGIILDVLYLQNTYSWKTILFSIVGFDLKSSIDTSMWFVSFLLIFYLTFYIIFSLNISNSLKTILMFIAALILKKHWFLFPENVGSHYYVYEFPIGILFAMNYHNITRLNKNLKYIFFVSAIILSIESFFILVEYMRDTQYIYWGKFFISLSFISLISLFSIIGTSLTVLRFVGEISYEIYLLEWVLLTKYKNIFWLFTENTLINYFVYLFVLIILAFILNRLAIYLRSKITSLKDYPLKEKLNIVWLKN